MAGRLNGKIAIVTGAGSGMGRAIAEAFVGEGAQVVCADVSGQQDEVAARLGATAIRADVSQSADVQALIATTEQRFGRVDVLVNNAGLGGPIGPLHEMEDDDFDRLVAVNLRGVYLGMKYGVRAMLRTGGGAIVNIASAGGLVGHPGLAGYTATKGGVVQLTRSGALDYAQQNIRINAVCPGLIWTAMVPGSDGSRTPPEGTPPPPGMPMGRWGLDTEIAAATVFLASDEVGFMSGVAMPVDGAFSAG